jgi:hypothetical protein
MNASTHHLALVPRDGFFVKDSRGWSTSARTHVLDWPWPTTVRGALTTVSGKIAERETGNRFGGINGASTRTRSPSAPWSRCG